MDRQKYFFELKRQKQSATEIVIPLSFSGSTTIAPEFRTSVNTSNLFINFGNGNSYTFNNESTYVASQTYAAGTYNIRITGALSLVSRLYLNSCGLIGTLKLSNLLLGWLEINGNPNLDNFISENGSCGYLYFDENLKTLTYNNSGGRFFHTTNNNSELTAITINSLSVGATEFQLNKVVSLTTLDLSKYTQFDVKIIVRGGVINTVTMPVNATNNAYIEFSGLQLTSIIDFSGLSGLGVNLRLNSSFSSASLLESQVLNILNWANSKSIDNKALYIDGTNPAANAQTITYINSLISRGWTVLYN